MVLHTTSVFDDEEMEVEADKFAGAFLLPEGEIRSQLTHFDLRQVTNLKRYWKVSMAAIAMRAFNLNLITPHQRKMFFIQLGKLGYRNAEPHEPPKEYPKKMMSLLAYFQSVLDYTKADLAKTLFISEAEMDQMYWLTNESALPGLGSTERPPLRIVK